jgi:hypothetical protein
VRKPLEYLLRENEVDHVVLTGQVTEQCILYSALDAYIRHFRVTIPRDAVAHTTTSPRPPGPRASTTVSLSFGLDDVPVGVAVLDAADPGRRVGFELGQRSPPSRRGTRPLRLAP